MTSRILNFLDAAAGTAVCSTRPAEAAVCFTPLVMELTKPEPADWTGWCRRSGARETAGAVGVAGPRALAGPGAAVGAVGRVGWMGGGGAEGRGGGESEGKGGMGGGGGG